MLGQVWASASVSPTGRGKSAILLWMGGGPSTIDVWDLKPGPATGGPFRPISTSGDGQICEHLPLLARQMHHFAIIRSMSTREVDHVRARQYLLSGQAPDRHRRVLPRVGSKHANWMHQVAIAGTGPTW